MTGQPSRGRTSRRLLARLARQQLMTGAALGAALLLVAASSAAAATAPPQTASSGVANLETRVAAVLAHNPGSARVGPDTVQLADGPRLVLTGFVTPQSASHSCPGGYLCLFQDSGFGGAMLQLSGCTKVNLYRQYMDTGRSWNDQASSIDNPGPSGGVSTTGTAHFYNFRGGSGDPMNLANDDKVLDLADGHYLKNLAKDSSQDGGNANDKIDVVVPC